MRQLLILLCLLLLTACSQPENGAADNSATSTDTISGTESPQASARVTGVGGIFFKAKDPAMMHDWYAKHLGMKMTEYGSMIEFRNTDRPDEIGYLQWSPFSDSTKYFEPSTKEFMINYRVEGMESLIDELRKAGVEIVSEIDTFSYGKFAHIMDPEGNKVELWEPVDSVFTRLYEGNTTH